MIDDRFRSFERFAIGALWVISIVFVAAMVIFSMPEYWKYTIEELGPMTWFESLLLFFTAIFAFLCAGLEFIGKRNKNTFLWSALAIGFIALCLDERFAIHERIRDRILAPLNIKLIFFWVSPGDIMLLLLMIAGLIFLVFIFKQFKERRLAMVLFLAAVLLSAIAVISDSFDFHKLSIEELRLEQFVEEIIETSAMILYASAVFLMFTHKLKNITARYD